MRMAREQQLKGKDLLFEWFGFDKTSKAFANSI